MLSTAAAAAAGDGTAIPRMRQGRRGFYTWKDFRPCAVPVCLRGKACDPRAVPCPPHTCRGSSGSTLDAVCRSDARLPCPPGMAGALVPMPGGMPGPGGGMVMGGPGGRGGGPGPPGGAPMSAMWSILHAYQYANFSPFPFPPHMAR
ncbi:hypothetical protein ACOMHN_053650 [Nucella lapillus]